MLIVNPASGGGRPKDKLAKALKFFAKKGDEVVVRFTSAPGDGALIARREGLVGFDAVVAAGGDGTIHEVIAALAGTDVSLGILPWGTGNVFAKEMRLPRRVKALCKVIRRGRAARVDLGLADGRPFLLMASVGFDADALGRVGVAQKRRWGMGAYALAAVGALVRYRHPEFTVTFDDGTTDRGSFILVSNTRLYGAFFVFLPRSDPADGLLDVLVYRDRGRWKFLGMVAQMLWHNLVTRSAAEPAFLARHGVHRVKGLRFEGTGAPAQVDGDPAEGLSSVSVWPGALRVLLPSREPHGKHTFPIQSSRPVDSAALQ